MSRRGRRHGAEEPPEGPLDPWTGKQGGAEESYYSPMGQVQAWGRLAGGLGRDPRSIRGYRRWIVRIGLVLIGLLTLLGIAAALFGAGGQQP